MPYPFHPVTSARPLVTGGLLAGLLLIGPASTPRVLAQAPVTAPPVADAPKATPLNIEIPDLNTADEASVQTAWTHLQEQLQEGEVTDPTAGIALCNDFLNKGGSRFGTVAVDVASHIAHLQFFELRHFDQAIETYSWAITNYPQVPAVERLKREREVVKQQGQQRQEGKAPPLPLVKLQDVRPPSPLQVAPMTLAALTLPPHLSIAPVRVPRSADFIVPRGDSLGWKPGSARRVTALARQSNGRLWVTTEDGGVWSYEEGAPPATRWKQFMAKDGVGDDSAYAVAVDKQNRVWVGTQSHGVSVWNGKGWKNYDMLDGPLGERIFALAVCPTDGDVWIATNAGLTRYSSSKDSWSYITRADGLPSDQVQDLAFDALGNLLVGTQCEGVAIASAADGYKNWRSVKGPEQMPTSPKGTGLPSNLINAVLVARDGTFYVGTTTGLAWSCDKGHTWSYVRGQDYAAKVRGLLDGPLAGWKEEPGALLAEDYVSCLAQDGAGHLWVGHWRAGDEVLDVPSGPSASGIKKVLDQEGSGLVRAILPMTSAAPLLARYDEGVGQSLIGAGSASATSSTKPVQSRTLMRTAALATEPVQAKAHSVFPPVAAAPTIDELRNLLKKMSAFSDALQPGDAAFVSEDWRTRGDWVGRYGRYYATLGAIQAPFDDTYASLMPFPEVVPQLGPHIQDADSIRRWIHWVKTEDGRTLYDPFLGYRRQAEWDDHGEVYPATFEGPDLWSSLQVPPGTWRISSYFVNKDGNIGDNRARDYLLELRHETTPLPPYPAPKDDEQVTGEWLQLHFGAYYAARTKIIEATQKTPPLATARVRDFWGGVHKSFVVQGPATYWLRVARGGSLDTIMSSIMWDDITPGKKWEDAPGLSWTGGKFNPPDPDVPAPPDPFLLDKILSGRYHEPSAPTDDDKKRAEVVKAARDLWAVSDAAMDKQGGATWQWQARLAAYRAAQANGAPDVLLQNWRWKMALWSDSDRAQWNEAMKRAAQSYAIHPVDSRSSQ